MFTKSRKNSYLVSRESYLVKN